MKLTLHSRHHSTVLPRLGSSRMKSHQKLYTHTVDSAIQLQGNNRVLKKRPPPISDEEQRLNRRQRCTLSQLRSGHCYLLQDYKHMVLGEPSDICTYCGASPQDVRHLFACITHPTDLSSEDLWRNPNNISTNLEFASPQSVMAATRLDHLVYIPNCYFRFSDTTFPVCTRTLGRCKPKNGGIWRHLEKRLLTLKGER